MHGSYGWSVSLSVSAITGKGDRDRKDDGVGIFQFHACHSSMHGFLVHKGQKQCLGEAVVFQEIGPG